MSMDATISNELDGRPTIRLERDLAWSMDEVWQAITDPAELERWFVEPIAWTPEQGETLEASGRQLRITELDEPRVIAWSWGEERYRIELDERDGGTHLTFLHAYTEEHGPGAQHALGWQVYLGRLSTHLAGNYVDELTAHEQALAYVLEGRPVLRFIRRLAHPPKQVWEAITYGDQLSRWFPCAVDYEMRVGGAMTFTFNPEFQPTGEVTDVDWHRRFEFTWGDDDIRMDLLSVRDGAETVLTFTHSMTEAVDAISKNAAGWHVCLDALARQLDDPAAPPVDAGATAEWLAHYDAYIARGYPAGAPIPTP
jgi:uncharacterized protein YndB with AHSA1/START domain